MSLAGLTFEGKKLYITNYETQDSKIIGQFQFMLFDGNTWKEEKQLVKSWNEKSDYYTNHIYNYDDEKWYDRLSFETNANFYFDASNWTETSIKLCIGHANYQKYYNLTQIPNTKLYYGKPGDTWGDAMGIGVVGKTTATDGTNWLTNVSSKAKEYTGFKNYGLTSTKSGHAYLMVNAGKTGEQPEMHYNESYTNLNSKQTIMSACKVTGGNYEETNTPAQISITSYALNGNGTSQKQNVSLATTAKSVSVDAARTATTTLKIEAVPDGYKFDGWFTRLNDGDRLSEELTYTYYPTEETTIYARFSEDVYYLAGTLDGNDAWNADELPMAKNSDGTYSYTFTNLDAGEYEFKVTDGTWGKNWNWNNVVGEYCELSKAAKDDNIKLTLSASTTFTITFNKTNNSISFEGLTDKYTYFLMGVKGDWTDGIQMVKHPNNNNEYMLTCQPIVKETDAIKVVKYKCGEANGYCGAVEDNSVEYTFTNDDNKNIVLNTGVYDFYYKISENKVYIGASSCVVEYSIAANPTEGGTVEGAGTYDHGANVTLTAKANEGYKFVNWTKGEVEVSTANPYEFTATEDVELVANFKATTITLTTGNNDAVIAANIGNTVDVVIQRSFTANDGYYTLCVPFNMPASVIGKVYSLGTITEHVAGEGININLEEKNELSAGMPYLVLPKEDMTQLVVENVTIAEDDIAGQGVSNEEGTVNIFFQGYYRASGQTNGSTEYYVGNEGYLYNGVVDIRGLCGLFTIYDENGDPLKVRARVVAREDAATGFDNITNGENTTIKLIENGQLIIIRGGEKFNAQGQKL